MANLPWFYSPIISVIYYCDCVDDYVNHFYHPQTKLRKGNVFPHVCHTFCPQRGHAWQGGMCGGCMGGACGYVGVHGGACVGEACRGCAWRGACMAGADNAWQERRSLQQMVWILLECFLVCIVITIGPIASVKTHSTTGYSTISLRRPNSWVNHRYDWTLRVCTVFKAKLLTPDVHPERGSVNSF